MVKLEKIGIIAKHTVPEKHRTCLIELVRLLEKNKGEIMFDEVTGPVFNKSGHSRAHVLSKVDIAIVLGGDGTLLKTARCLGKKPTLILGINMGNVGFLTSIAPKEIARSVTRLFKGEYIVDERDLLRVTVYRGGKKIHTSMALNEAVINQGGFARVIDLDVSVNKRKLAKYRADGLIVSTPTGSTGHSLSSGGPVVHPRVDAFIVAPICSLRLGVRPIIIPGDRIIEITLKTEWREAKKPIVLTVDGQEAFNLHKDDIVRLRTSSRNMRMVRFKGTNYYAMLRKKLNWGA